MPTIDTDTSGSQYIQKTNTGSSGESGGGIGAIRTTTHEYATGDVGVAEALAAIDPAGLASTSAWAAVGSTFSVTGSEARNFQIYPTGNIEGTLFSLFGGTAEGTVTLICSQVATDVTFDTQLAHKETDYGVDGEAWESVSLSGSLSVNLDPDYDYEVLVKITSSASTDIAGGAVADVDDSDGGTEKVTVDQFEFVRG
ncbi:MULTISPECIES: hypothetical protein [Halorussus]|uniref:hypothetical protein n=1 Tax=Halorussus TaxID=1070314 RepID=UPI00209F5413|nr:hypothetical protein [Halorussus vallis]USZ78465.1 hypothetical protein NGM07_24280 [Halorussus vallis]USZ78497.1 hypothetical protein NGM07_23695 [Halorussus vallis]